MAALTPCMPAQDLWPAAAGLESGPGLVTLPSGPIHSRKTCLLQTWRGALGARSTLAASCWGHTLQQYRLAKVRSGPRASNGKTRLPLLAKGGLRAALP